jgi:hypothetical protein
MRIVSQGNCAGFFEANRVNEGKLSFVSAAIHMWRLALTCGTQLARPETFRESSPDPMVCAMSRGIQRNTQPVSAQGINLRRLTSRQTMPDAKLKLSHC